MTTGLGSKTGLRCGSAACRAASVRQISCALGMRSIEWRERKPNAAKQAAGDIGQAAAAMLSRYTSNLFK